MSESIGKSLEFPAAWRQKPPQQHRASLLSRSWSTPTQTIWDEATTRNRVHLPWMARHPRPVGADNGRVWNDPLGHGESHNNVISRLSPWVERLPPGLMDCTPGKDDSGEATGIMLDHQSVVSLQIQGDLILVTFACQVTGNAGARIACGEIKLQTKASSGEWGQGRRPLVIAESQIFCCLKTGFNCWPQKIRSGFGVKDALAKKAFSVSGLAESWLSTAQKKRWLVASPRGGVDLQRRGSPTAINSLFFLTLGIPWVFQPGKCLNSWMIFWNSSSVELRGPMTIQRGSGTGLKVSLEYLANDGIWKEMKKSPETQAFWESENGGKNWLGQRPELYCKTHSNHF